MMKHLNTWYGALFAIPIVVACMFAFLVLMGLIIKAIGGLY